MDKIFNTVAVISRLKGVSIEKALVETTKLVKEYEELLHRVGEQILSQLEPEDEAESLIKLIKYLLGGIFKAQSVVDR